MTNAKLWAFRTVPLLALLPAALIKNGSLLSLAITIASLAAIRKSRRPTLALRQGSWLNAIAIGLASGLLLWLASHFLLDPVLEAWLGPVDLSNFAAVRGNLRNFMILLSIGLVYGGILEELIFRGFVIGWGTELWGPRSAVVLWLLSSAVFGLAHRYQGLSGMISTLVSGLVFGAVYLAAGRRLVPAVITHMVFDTIGITMIYLGLS